MAKRRRLNEIKPVGYAGLKEMLNIESLPHYRKSYILSHGSAYSERENHQEIHYYPKKYFPNDFQNPLNHLEFALKYDGINLEIIFAAFQKLEPSIFEEFVRSQPTSKFARKIWYLYEFLTGKILDLNNAEGGSYTLLLDPKAYYTGTAIRSRRHYIDDNMLGNPLFCPIVRQTQKLKKFDEKNLPAIANKLIQQYDPGIIARAVNYLYYKETMSSYEIEREKPDSARSQRFVEALRKADHIGSLSKRDLIDLQNMIVDPRFADKDYRNYQNYIGIESRLDIYRSIIEYISPKPEDVSGLMQGLLDSLERMIYSHIHPVVVAAAIAFGFVFIHPFEDGNGRLHRFIMHYIFARCGFVPKGAIFPVSAVILKEITTYDNLLETFSKPLLNLIKNYELNSHGELSVFSETSFYYRYIDYTQFVEYLFECIEKTIYTDFKNELNYIVHYDKAKRKLQEIVDMPDKKMNLFIQCVIQNHGILSAKKRETLFSFLTDEETVQLEEIVRKNMCEPVLE